MAILNLPIMKKILTSFMLLLTLYIGAQHDPMVQQTIKTVLMQNQNQLLQLAEAFDTSQYNYTPMEGVNTVGEVLLHVAGANYFLGSKMGFTPPDEVDLMNLNSINGKENIIKALKESMVFAQNCIEQVEVSQLNHEVDFGFTKANLLGGLLMIMEHNGEHKGQLIAYARSNGIVPPWSR